MVVTNRDLLEILNLDVKEPVAYSLGLSNSIKPSTMSFCADIKYVNEIKDNDNIKAVITTKVLRPELSHKKLILEVEDPRHDFYILLNTIGKKAYVRMPSSIHSSASIHPKAHVSEFNVTIGANTIISPNATILSDVEIGENCIIQPGTVVGSEGFEYKRTTKGILPVFHDGKVIIGNRVEIGSNTCVDKGFSFRFTIIEDEVKIDNLVHIAHGVYLKRGSFIIAGSILGGSVEIGEEAWVSINGSIAPGLKIGRKSFVSIGAVVTKNVLENQQVTGNFAMPHDTFLKNLKQILNQAKK